MDLHDVAPELDKWVDDHCIITKADRVESTLNGEAMYAEVVAKKLLELVKEKGRLEEKIEAAKNCLVCASISDPSEVCENALEILEGV